MKIFDTKLKQASYSILMIIIVLAVLLIVNLIADTLNLDFDMTEKGLFSLSEETETILNELENDVDIYALYKPGRESEQIVGVLDQYSDFKRVTLKIIDPDRNPALLAQFQTDDEALLSGSVVVKSGSYWKVIKPIDLYSVNYTQAGPQVYGQKIEQQITSAIAYVMTGRIPKVYSIYGHNEYSLSESGIDIELIAANFEIETLNIITNSGIPDDADMLVLIGPKRDFTEYEAGKLKTYLDEGGKLFAALGYSENKMENLHSILKTYDLEIMNGLVMETNTSRLLAEFNDNPFFFAPYPGESSITDYVKKSQLDPLLSASIGFMRTESEKRNLEFNTILTSSDNSWLRIDLSNQFDGMLASDVKGPVNVAVTINGTNRDTGEDEGARIVVIGSALAFTPLPGMGVLPGNVKLLIGSLFWLDNNKSTVMVPSKSLFSLPLRIDTARALIYAGIVTILIPLIILISALVIYRKRKNL